MTLHTPECFASHMGLWAISPDTLTGLVAAVRAGTRRAIRTPEMMAGLVERRGYDAIGRDGRIAVIPVAGEITKGVSKYGGASAVLTQRSVRSAAADKSIEAILLLIDSPGGQVDGVDALAQEVKRADKVKPVFAQIEDMGGSAAYWIASQARKITANRTAEVGSIGVFAVLADTSKAAEMEGVTVHVVSTGGLKGAGADGTPITDDVLAYMAERVGAVNAIFQDSIKTGRRMSDKQLAAVSDGRVWIAAQAKSLHLIDAVQSSDETLAELEREVDSIKKAEKVAGRQRTAEAQVAVMRMSNS